MASTSPNNDDVPPFEENDVDDEEEEEEEDDDDKEEEEGASEKIELNLRLGANSEQESRSSDLLRDHHVSASAVVSSSSITTLLQLQGGLGLGFHNGSVGRGSVVAPPPGNPRSSSSPCHVGSEPSDPHVLCGDLHMQLHRNPDSNRRPETNGLWFTLRSAPNRKGEMLPQVPKAYIRVKDENLTVLIVKKYLAAKLVLTSELEIDISCMGQPLLHFQTLKYVRDVIWRPRLIESLNAIASRNADNETSLNHLMPLHYGKHCVG